MRQLTIGDRVLTDEDCFIVAEIGSNHGGDPEVCAHMIEAAARCGADAVKLQKRDNSAMFTKTALAKSYDNDFSLGKTYGEHRNKLDWFGKYEFIHFQGVAERCGILFFATPFEERSADFLHDLNVPLWKIASCDVRNIPLVRKVAKYHQPMLISTGGCTLEDVQRLTEAIEPMNKNYALLHCVSIYPNTDENVNLGTITYLRERFPYTLIGFSSHHAGLQPVILARALGASIFEVHFTLNRGQRGTDHGFSMEPKGLAQLCEDLKRVKVMIGDEGKSSRPEEVNGFISKMGKGIYLQAGLHSGDRISEDNIVIKSPAMQGGLEPYEVDEVIGKELLNDCSTGVCLRKEMLK